MEHKILLVDDDRDLLEMLCSIFRRAGYTELVTAASGPEALQVWREQQPALIVLDVMMPGMDGFAVLREIRRTSRVPVLMLTARGEAEDRIEGLEIGADDYLPKPFLPKELLLRVQAILHRTYPEPHRTVELAASTVDLEKAEVWKNGECLPLTAKELQLFQKLYENAGRIVTTGILCETICGEFWQGYESTLSTHIRHLREKIEENPSKPVSLVTAKGLGYRLNLRGRNREPGTAVFSALYFLYHWHFGAVPRGESPAGPDGSDRWIHERDRQRIICPVGLQPCDGTGRRLDGGRHGAGPAART